MLKSSITTLWDFLTAVGDFFVPAKQPQFTKLDISHVRTAALIPTYNPTRITYNTVRTLMKWYPFMLIVVIDDSTPLKGRSLRILNKIKKLSSENPNLVYLRTPQNSLKAGALNFGINHLLNMAIKPDVVFSFDDDVNVNRKTLPILINHLYSNDNIGAVCSRALVKNKNKNILTRLQSLEYHNFNISKIADNTLFMGPLVMQGMLTAFRTQALEDVRGFALNHLIEDYDITVRLKVSTWKVKIAHTADAWTTVPESIEGLWKQRIRWSLGGLQVVSKFWKYVPAIFQDALGHLLFLALFSLIILSFFLPGNNENSDRVYVLLILAGLQLSISFIFGLLTLRSYQSRDFKDWILKFALIPEFIYSNLLSFILIGSYLFFIYTGTGKFITRKIKYFGLPYNIGLFVFSKLGYSSSWGTRIN